MKEMGEAFYVIGMEIDRDRSLKTLELSYKAYIEKVPKIFNMQNYSPIATPIVNGENFNINQCPQTSLEEEKMKGIPYTLVVGSLMHA